MWSTVSAKNGLKQIDYSNSGEKKNFTTKRSNK